MNRIYTFSLIKTFYDQGQDYLDAFWPLLLRVLPSDGGYADLGQVADSLREEFAFAPPRHALDTIATRGSRKGFLTREAHAIALTREGIEHLAKSEGEREVERRINSLVEAAHTFLKDRGHDIQEADLLSLLQSFIAAHLEFFEKFVRGQEAESPIISKDVEAVLLEFLQTIEHSNPELFRTLHEVFLGSIVSSAVYTGSFGDVSEKFGRTKVFLDTNVVFSLLGFHFPEVNGPTQELFELMKQLDVFEFFVFDFTIEEIVAVLRPYARRQHRFVSDIRVDSIFSSLKARGWSKSDMRQFLATIEDRLAEQGISVQPTEVRLKSYSVEPSVLSALRKYKPQQGSLGQVHDLAAIALVKRMRGGVVRRLERARYFFLTADARLTRYDLEVEGHEDDETVAEVVPDRVLATFLWLKDPKRTGDVPLHTVVAMHSKELLINRDVWDRFFDTVVDLREAGRISDADVGVLLYDKEVQSYLRKVRPAQVTSEEVLTQAQAAKGRLEALQKKERAAASEAEERASELQAQFSSDLEDLKDQARIAEAEREEDLLDAISDAKAGIESECRAQSVLIVRAALFVLGLIGTFLIFRTTNQDQLLLAQIGAAAMWVLLLIGAVKDPKDIRSDVETGLFNHLYRRRLARSRLDQVEASLKGELGGEDRPGTSR